MDIRTGETESSLLPGTSDSCNHHVIMFAILVDGVGIGADFRCCVETVFNVVVETNRILVVVVAVVVVAVACAAIVEYVVAVAVSAFVVADVIVAGAVPGVFCRC